MFRGLVEEEGTRLRKKKKEKKVKNGKKGQKKRKKGKKRKQLHLSQKWVGRNERVS